MSDEALILILRASIKAEACRRLANTAENESRKALWIERADHWDRLADKAASSSPDFVAPD
jgi:hypothetical protein